MYLAALLVASLGPAGAQAGGGPENVLVVVNSASWASQAVANHYIRLRHIPLENVCYVEWNQGFGSTDIETFRREILNVALRQIVHRNLESQIDYIVYSSDFPTAIALEGDVQGLNLPEQLGPTASLNSATFFWQTVLARSPTIIGLENNHYMRASADRTPAIPIHGFRSWYGWGAKGELLEAGGQHYFLSTMLAVTSGRGNSVSEAIRYLGRSAQADGTHPAGTIYYMKNNDIRSTARDAGFAAAAEELRKMDVAAVVESGIVPTGRRDVQGLMVGSREINWRRSQSTILPGALCEHFTSYGGVLSEGSYQTPLTELLRYGAAGASGTVAEPFSIWQKFPAPRIQVYYASGCTLAEAFYQSVSGPYQLLIVGDPLCRPWASIPEVTAGDLAPEARLNGTVEIHPSAEFADREKKLPGGDTSRQVGLFELYVDGLRVASARPDAPLVLDTRRAADGFHEVRIVATADGAIETQGRTIVHVYFDNHGRTIDFTASAESKEAAPEKDTTDKKHPPEKPAPAGAIPTKTVSWDQDLVLTAQAPGASEVFFFCNGRVLGQVTGDDTRLVVDPRRLGSGPVELRAWGRTAGQPAMNVLSRPIELIVEPNRPLAAWQPPRGARLVRGMQLRAADGKAVPVHETFKPTWLREAGVKPGEPWQLEGMFDVPDTDTYQFQLWHDGDLKLSVDGRALYDSKAGNEREQFVAVALAKGLHRLHLAGVAGANVRMRIAFGGEGTLTINGTQFRHVSQ